MTNTLTADRLRELLHYDAATGIFTWRVGRQGVRKVSRGRAGGPDGQGYIRIKVDGRYFGAHRLAWLYETGSWPCGQIDHLDGDRTNNRFQNLRSVPIRVNRENLRVATVRSKSGLLGVCAPTRQCKDYIAQIGVDGRKVRLGRFPTAEQAHAAYLAAKRTLHEGCTL